MNKEKLIELYEKSLKKWERLKRFVNKTEHVGKIKHKAFDTCAFCDYCNKECYRCPVEDYICDEEGSLGILGVIRQITDLGMLRDAIQIGAYLIRTALEKARRTGRLAIPLKKEKAMKEFEKKKNLEEWT